MLRYFLSGICALLLLSSCVKHDRGCVEPPSVYLNATVAQVANMDCGRPAIDFEDPAAIKAITGKDHTRFIVDQLPEDLKVQGQKIAVKVTALPPDEDFHCLTWGPGYPHIKIVQARAR